MLRVLWGVGGRWQAAWATPAVCLLLAVALSRCACCSRQRRRGGLGGGGGGGGCRGEGGPWALLCPPPPPNDTSQLPALQPQQPPATRPAPGRTPTPAQRGAQQARRSCAPDTLALPPPPRWALQAIAVAKANSSDATANAGADAQARSFGGSGDSKASALSSGLLDAFSDTTANSDAAVASDAAAT